MAKGTRRNTKNVGQPKLTDKYTHPTAELLLRPDVGTQAQFKKKKPPVTYRYDSSLSPAMDWDGQNAARDLGAFLVRCIEEAARLPAPHTFPEPRPFKNSAGQVVATVRGLQDAVEQLKRIEKPFLNWAGKAERLSFDVPTLPLFIHERLSTEAILQTLKGHKRDKQMTMFDLFGDREHPIHDQVLKAYEHKNGWVNRMILGDSLAVMNSLLHYEGLGGQVQMIYMDPPYGVKFGSNFQPFVRKRDVKHNDDDDMTREPEMVKAYRDTWELGLHSYLTYMRDRLLLSRELLAPTGSVFVQISDENVHHIRELMDEVFGTENFYGLIAFQKTTSASGEGLPSVADYLLWYARDLTHVKVRDLYLQRLGEGWVNYDYVQLKDGQCRRMTADERADWNLLPAGASVYRRDNLTSQRPAQEGDVRSYEFEGKTYNPGKGTFKTDLEGLKRLHESNRLEAYGVTLAYRRHATDFPYLPLNNVWTDTVTGGYVEQRYYVVQTNTKVIQRCMLMTTDPGDLVLDPTCGSGSTACVAEQWGRRWITIDTSRVPLALARQRLLTATFPYYQLKDESRGPAGGFVYERRQNSKGEDVGGIVPHITLKSITNNEPPGEEVLVDRPEEDKKITRVTGPFCVEATIPTPVDWEGDGEEDSGAGTAVSHGSFVDRMLEVLRKSPLLHVGGGKTVTLRNIRPPAKTLSLSAEALVELSVASGQLSGESHGTGIPGFGGVAKGDAPRDGGLPGDTGVSRRGAIRAGEPDAPGGGFDSEQHRGGARPPDSGGIPTIRGAGSRERGGTRNTDRDRGQPGSARPNDGSNSDGTGERGGEDSQRSVGDSSLTTDNRQLKTAPVAIIFGPENGAISEKLVYEAAREAHAKVYSQLFVIGNKPQPTAQIFIQRCNEIVGIPAIHIQWTPDIFMGDLLKNMRSSQIFSVCGQPEIKLRKADPKAVAKMGANGGGTWYQVELVGFDVFDPITMEVDHRKGDDVPAWLLDTNYNGLCFHVCQAFFPRTAAWDDLKRSLKGEFDDSVWEHLAGTVSTPFQAGEHQRVAVKVIDDRGNELPVEKSVKEAE